MSIPYLKSFQLASAIAESNFITHQNRTCYNGIYPFKIFPEKHFAKIEFQPITIFYGGNGSGKSTLLNIIAEKLNFIRHSSFSGSPFFKDYISLCNFEAEKIPESSQILTSDDVSDYLLNIRYLNDGIDIRRAELFQEYLDRKYATRRFTGMADYEDWKESYEAKSKSQSRFVRERLMRNVDMFSNGESAVRFFTEHITEDALYLLDEPENSLSIPLQIELAEYLQASVKYYGCQFILSSHSPVFLSLENALIYDLDVNPVCTKKWFELGNMIAYFNFFEKHRSLFLPSKKKEK